MSEHKNEIDKENDKFLTAHEYDGIRECDYPLPAWWVASFWLTTLFGIGYFIYYQLAGGPTLQDELNSELAQFQTSKAASADQSSVYDQSKFDEYLNNAEKFKIGETTYNSMCVACHKPMGAGDIGPNLTDKYWKNGDGTPKAIYTTVKDGIPDKGMPAWGAILGPEKTMAVSAYVRSLQGAKVEKPKIAEGKLFE